MARVPMVTRTIVTTVANVMCTNISEGVTFTEEYIVPRTYKDDETLLKAVKEYYETDTIKPVYIIGKNEVETLYGMSEADFISHAKVMPPRTNKVDDMNEMFDDSNN